MIFKKKKMAKGEVKKAGTEKLCFYKVGQEKKTIKRKKERQQAGVF
jgi:hypothetical protein